MDKGRTFMKSGKETKKGARRFAVAIRRPPGRTGFQEILHVGRRKEPAKIFGPVLPFF